MKPSKKIKVAVSQPKRDAENYEANIETAIKYIESTPDDVRLLVFPEGFPGPWWLQPDRRVKDVVKGPVEGSKTYSALVESIGDRELVVGFGITEKLGDRLYNSYALITGMGLLGVYRKKLPAVFEINAPIPISQANETKVWEIDGVKVGVAICWEALFPEIPRKLAKQGAEIMIFPTGGFLNELRDSWRTVWLARAIENLAYVLCNVSIYGEELGAALIAGPESILAETTVSGLISASLDIERIRWLRSVDEELTTPKKYRVVPGLLRWAERIPKD